MRDSENGREIRGAGAQIYTGVQNRERPGRSAVRSAPADLGRSAAAGRERRAAAGRGKTVAFNLEDRAAAGSERSAAAHRRRRAATDREESTAAHRRRMAAAGRKEGTAVGREESTAVNPERESAARGKRTVPDRRRETAVHGGYRERLRAHRRGKLCRILTGIGLVLAAGYIGAAFYFHSHFYNGTTILGMDCSGKTVEQVKQEVSLRMGEYELTILERADASETISADEIALGFEDDGSIDRMMKAQRAWFWPVMALLSDARADSVAFSYDRNLAEARISSLACMDSIRAAAPKDAYIGPTDYGFEVVPEVMGTTLNKDRAKEQIYRALDLGKDSVSLEEEDCYVNPQIYRDNEELVRDAASMSELASANFTFDFGTQQETVNSSLIREWLTEPSDGVFAIDESQVAAYVESLAAKYDTFGLPVDFYTSLGTTVTLSGGDYGWCIDQDATQAALMEALESGFRGTMEPVYLYSAMSHENGGIGYTYVEICLSQQRMWCYENGNVIVDTPVVTGNPNKGDATPSGGVWAIDAKKRNAILTGEGYTSPVDYWMPFNGDVGIHDLKERAYFGGTIYLTNGSHGCVNTPYDQVQTIYNTVSIGTPVIVYE